MPSFGTIWLTCAGEAPGGLGRRNSSGLELMAIDPDGSGVQQGAGMMLLNNVRKMDQTEGKGVNLRAKAETPNVRKSMKAG
jgi:hypothetical protein